MKIRTTWFAAVSLLCLSAVIAFAQGGRSDADRKIPFLGVATEPLSPQVAAHLDLPEGIGLLVVQVTADSPSASVLVVNDILTKFADQWLVDPRQLAAVVRLQKPGDEVAIEFIRKGTRKTAKVKLGQRDWTPLPEPQPPAGRGAIEPIPFPFPQPRWPFRGDDFGWLPGRDPVLDSSEQNEPDDQPNVNIRTSFRSVRRLVENGISYTLTETDGDRQFEIKDADGKVIFEGPVNTDKEIAAIPEEHRDAFDRLSGPRGRRAGPRPGRPIRPDRAL